MGRMSSSRHTECTRKDRPAFSGPPWFGGIPFPEQVVSKSQDKAVAEDEGKTGRTYIGRRSIPLQVWLDGLVLLVEVRQVWHKILDDVGVWQGVDLHLLGLLGRNAACYSTRSQSPVILTLDIFRYFSNWRFNLHKQASVFMPLMFIAQLPQIPSLQLLRNVRVGSSSFLMRTRASSTMGPVLLRSRV